MQLEQQWLMYITLRRYGLAAFSTRYHTRYYRATQWFYYSDIVEMAD